MEQSGAKAYLVNTGWNGTGKRISIKDTRGIIDAILNGDIYNAPTKTIPYFNFEVPTELKVLIQESLTHVTHTQMLLNGKKKQKILLQDSSRTSLNTKETKLVKHLLLLVLSYNFIFEPKRGCRTYGQPHYFLPGMFCFMQHSGDKKITTKRDDNL